MPIENKEGLIEKLANPLLQGFDADGNSMMFSIFDDMDRDRSQEINKAINQNLRRFLASQPIMFELNPIEWLQVASDGLELNNPEEVGQFLFHAGYMYGMLDANIESVKRRDEQ